MSNIAQAIEEFAVLSPVSEINLSGTDWTHPLSRKDITAPYNIEDQVRRRLNFMGIDEETCEPLVLDFIRNEIRDNDTTIASIVLLFCMALTARDDALINDEQIIKIMSWGPYAQAYFDNQTTYAMRDEIDGLGGLQAYAQRETLEIVRNGLKRVVTEANQYDRHMKQLMCICFSGQDSMDTKLLSWFIRRAEQKEVAVIDKAEINYSYDGHFIAQGGHYKHPLLGSDKDDRYLSSGRDSGMYTSALVAYWPELRLARTISRFYLFPNGVTIPDHLAPIITKMDNGDVLDTLRDYELNLPKLEDKEERKFRDELIAQVDEEVARVLEPEESDPDELEDE
ncbi:MAG: hypothetical protein ABF335_09705 [Alphaproteobacteria bacterium]